MSGNHNCVEPTIGHLNCTLEEVEEVFFPEAVIVFSLCPLTVTLNATVILVIWKDPYKELRGTAANYFILNLAVCDLLIGFPGELLFGLIHWFPDNHMLIAGYSINQRSVSCFDFYDPWPCCRTADCYRFPLHKSQTSDL
ncbi:hypothetical protein ABFA07_012449 [Porites harrisoni]